MTEQTSENGFLSPDVDLDLHLSMQRGLNDICSHACMRLPLSETVRKFFTSAAFLLAIDFHKSASNCLANGSHAVAAALLRPILECAVTAAWFQYRADEQRLFKLNANPLDLHHMWIDEADVPSLAQMLRELEEVVYMDEYVTNMQQLFGKGGRGKFFHKYTHPTVFQLKRTFVKLSDPVRFTDHEVRGLIALADLGLLACASVFQAQTQDHDLRCYIKYRYDLILSRLPESEERVKLTPWSPLPQTHLDP